MNCECHCDGYFKTFYNSKYEVGKDAWRIFGLIFLSLLASYKNKNE